MTATHKKKHPPVDSLSLKNRLLRLGVTALCVIGTDQASKSWAITHLKGIYPQSFFMDVFRLEYSENPGAFLGLGAGLSNSWRFGVLNIFVTLVLALSVFYLLRSKVLSAIQVWAMALLTTGGASNLWDRFFRDGRHVVDFMNLGIGPLRTGIFNVADVAIMGGIFLFLIASWREE